MSATMSPAHFALLRDDNTRLAEALRVIAQRMASMSGSDVEDVIRSAHAEAARRLKERGHRYEWYILKAADARKGGG